MEERLYNLFKSEREVLKAILEYFSLKNKVLWEGTWSSGSKTIQDISKYQTVEVYVGLGSSVAMLYLRDSKLEGGTVIGYPAWFATAQYTLGLNGDVATMSGTYLGHSQNSDHSTITTTTITKIIGIDPILPDALKNIIGGGQYRSTIFGRWSKCAYSIS